MSWIPRGARRAFRLGRSSTAQVEADFDDELRFHLAMREADLQREGLGAAEAREEARRRYGDADDARRYCGALGDRATRRERRRDWLAGWGQDLRFAARQLRAAPTLTIVAALTLALGIGAATVIFSAVHRMILAPLPYPAADRLVTLSRTIGDGSVQITPSALLVEAWAARARSLGRMARFSRRDYIRTGDGEAETLRGVAMSAELLPTLGARPALGRGFVPDEATAGGAPVAMLSYGYWQRRYGGRRDAIGSPITLDNRTYTVVGVLPRDFALLGFTIERDREVAVPYVPSPADFGLQTIARLRDGATAEAASAELTRIALDIEPTRPGRTPSAARARTIDQIVPARNRTMLFVMLGAVGVLLLIACANVAGLLLARATTRQRELAVRAALGAGRGRLVRQLLTESALLGLLGGALGLAAGWVGLRVLVRLRPPSLEQLEGLRLEPAVIGVALGVTLVVTLLFGLAPAVLAARSGVGASMAGGARTVSAHRGAGRLRALLVGVEVALSIVLLACAGLLVRSVLALQAVDPGFAVDGLLAVDVELPERIAEESRAGVYAQLEAATRRLPGVTSAAMASDLPPQIGVMFGALDIEGRSFADGERPEMLEMQGMQPGFPRLAGIRLLAGRAPADTTEHWLLVSETFARRFWPAGTAVGRRLRIGGDGAMWQTVTGVLADVRTPGSDGPADGLRIYTAFDATWKAGALVVRTHGTTPRLLTQLTAATAAIDPTIRLGNVRTARAQLDRQLAEPRFTMALLAGFGATALLLAMIGLYGVVALSVAQRTREIGVRMALGARPAAVLRGVVTRAMLLTGAGIAAGLVLAAIATRAVRSMLYDVQPVDVPTFALAALLLAVVALAAAAVPARRAARVDPIVALRAD